MVLMETPANGVSSKAEVIDYYVDTLEKVLGRLCFYNLKKDQIFMCFNKFLQVLWLLLIDW